MHNENRTKSYSKSRFFEIEIQMYNSSGKYAFESGLLREIPLLL